jgi:hypothetical protein
MVASVVIVVDLAHGQNPPPSTKVNVVEPDTLTSSAVSPLGSCAVVSMETVVTLLVWSPSEQQTVPIIAELLVLLGTLQSAPGSVAGGGQEDGHATLLTLETPHVTTASLAPLLTAFFREFLTYHALENSVIPKRITNSRRRTSAVSINAWPFLRVRTLLSCRTFILIIVLFKPKRNVRSPGRRCPEISILPYRLLYGFTSALLTLENTLFTLLPVPFTIRMTTMAIRTSSNAYSTNV